MTLGDLLQAAAQFNIYFCLDIREQVFPCCLALRSLFFKSSNKRCNEVTRIRIAEEYFFFLKVWRIECRCRDMLLFPGCCICVFEVSLLRHKMIQSRILVKFGKVFVQSCTHECCWMSLENECFFEESVTIRSTKRLKDWINVANVTYICILSIVGQYFCISAHFA